MSASGDLVVSSWICCVMLGDGLGVSASMWLLPSASHWSNGAFFPGLVVSAWSARGCVGVDTCVVVAIEVAKPERCVLFRGCILNIVNNLVWVLE